MTSPQKKLLVLNGSHSDIPLILSGKKLGFHVITTGNNPKLIGHSYGDEYHCADFSDKEDILALSHKLKIDAICACANDFGAITASYVAEQLNLPGHDSFENCLTIHHKDKFKAFTLKNGVPTPKAQGFDKIKKALSRIDTFSLPLIVKPVDLTGGKGVTRVFDRKDLETAVKKAFEISPQHRIVIEEFIDGTLHSFSSFLYKQKIQFYFSDNEYSYLNPNLVSTSAAPSVNIREVSRILIDESEKIARLLSLKDGIFHIQYIYKNGQVNIIEITRRCSGDLYPYPVNNATGLNWEDWIVKSSVGMDCSDFPEAQQKGFYGRHCIMASENGVVEHVVIDNAIKENICGELIWWKQGDKITNYLVDKLGVVFLKFDSKTEMHQKVSQINQLIKVILSK